MPSSFFCKTTATSVWKSVTGVSAAGSKRGRGKGMGKAIVKDFNKGQYIGQGRKKLIMGGLNSRVVDARRMVEIQDVGENPRFEQSISEWRSKMDTYSKFREAPLDRGWSGRKSHGRSAGTPSPRNETEFTDFESTVLMLRSIPIMTGVFGRAKLMQALVAVGNKDGLIGFADRKGKDGRATVRHARNLATQNLVYIPRWENHTVLHDFHSKYHETAVFVERKPRGYGLNCHRVLKAICHLAGITDLFAKTEGVKCNQINLTKAFFLGLMKQRQYQEIAEEKRLHLVDMREETFNYPQVLASPKDNEILTEDKIKVRDLNYDFTYYINEGRVKLAEYEFTPPYVGTQSWTKHLDRLDLYKNREEIKLELAAHYGDTEVLDVFPYFRNNSPAFKKAQGSN